MIKLSICIPTFNRAQHLNNCLSSIISARKSKGFQFEVCVSDNGSNDNTQEIVNNAKKNIDNYQQKNLFFWEINEAFYNSWKRKYLTYIVNQDELKTLDILKEIIINDA